jgi:hypothetical protein
LLNRFEGIMSLRYRFEHFRPIVLR